MYETIICQKCEALLIDEEFETHECGLNYRFEGDFLLIRRNGKWRKIHLSTLLGDQPKVNTDNITDKETEPALRNC